MKPIFHFSPSQTICHYDSQTLAVSPYPFYPNDVAKSSKLSTCFKKLFGLKTNSDHFKAIRALIIELCLENWGSTTKERFVFTSDTIKVLFNDTYMSAEHVFAYEIGNALSFFQIQPSEAVVCIPGFFNNMKRSIFLDLFKLHNIPKVQLIDCSLLAASLVSSDSQFRPFTNKSRLIVVFDSNGIEFSVVEFNEDKSVHTKTLFGTSRFSLFEITLLMSQYLIQTIQDSFTSSTASRFPSLLEIFNEMPAAFSDLLRMNDSRLTCFNYFNLSRKYCDVATNSLFTFISNILSKHCHDFAQVSEVVFFGPSIKQYYGFETLMALVKKQLPQSIPIVHDPSDRNISQVVTDALSIKVMKSTSLNKKISIFFHKKPTEAEIEYSNTPLFSFQTGHLFSSSNRFTFSPKTAKGNGVWKVFEEQTLIFSFANNDLSYSATGEFYNDLNGIFWFKIYDSKTNKWTDQCCLGLKTIQEKEISQFLNSIKPVPIVTNPIPKPNPKESEASCSKPTNLIFFDQSLNKISPDSIRVNQLPIDSLTAAFVTDFSLPSNGTIFRKMSDFRFFVRPSQTIVELMESVDSQTSYPISFDPEIVNIFLSWGLEQIITKKQLSLSDELFIGSNNKPLDFPINIKISNQSLMIIE